MAAAREEDAPAGGGVQAPGGEVEVHVPKVDVGVDVAKKLLKRWQVGAAGGGLLKLFR